MRDKDDDIDYPYYVTAHEVAHQWWAHQVSARNGRARRCSCESLAQYSALMVMEKEYGREKMQQFPASYELDRYLRGRGGERRRSCRSCRVENQPYIHYRKGSLVMYALRDYIGEDAMNAALGSFWRSGAQRPAVSDGARPHADVRAVTPDSLNT